MPGSLPPGTVTFHVTDIEGSTKLARQHRRAHDAGPRAARGMRLPRPIATAVLIALLVAFSAGWANARTARAQSETGYDLVSAVNALRAQHGLAPYTVDPGIMGYAQEHAEYQASTNTSTHIHSDGSLSLSAGLKENVAAGDVGVVTVSVVVYQIWVDTGHRRVLTGYASGEIGAGVALSDSGTMYYVVNVRPGEEVASTAAPFAPLQTSTPAQDGSLVHTVLPGQTLWEIAVSYGVTIDQIRSLNDIASDSTVIQPGQVLLIRLAGASAATEVASTAAAADSTTVLTIPPPSPAPSATASATPTPLAVAVPAAPSRTRVVIAMVLTVTIPILLIAAGIGFRKAYRQKMTQIEDFENSSPPRQPPRGM